MSCQIGLVTLSCAVAQVTSARHTLFETRWCRAVFEPYTYFDSLSHQNEPDAATEVSALSELLNECSDNGCKGL
jgi:hypothetical protein